MYGTAAIEVHRPSLASSTNKSHGIPFIPSAQTANNVQEVIKCTECEKPRVLYAARKLPAIEKIKLRQLIEPLHYSCGASWQELQDTEPIDNILQKVFAKANATCPSCVEVPYYTCGSFEDVCHHCRSNEDLSFMLDFYPYCPRCSKKKHNRRAKRKMATDANGSKKSKSNCTPEMYIPTCIRYRECQPYWHFLL